MTMYYLPYYLFSQVVFTIMLAQGMIPRTSDNQVRSGLFTLSFFPVAREGIFFSAMAFWLSDLVIDDKLINLLRFKWLGGHNDIE